MSSSSQQSVFHTKPKLLAILQMGGASGQLFTAEQVVNFLGKYIEKKKLYDPVNKRVIRCKDDLLGEVFQVDQFVVSNFKNLWKYLCPCLQVATQKEVMMKQVEPKEGESGSESELPWWYYVKRDQSDANLSQTTGKDSYDDRDTVGVRDTEYEDSEHADPEYFLEEYEPVSETDSDATEPITSDEETTTNSEIEILQQFDDDDDDDDEDDATDFSIDSDIALEERWKCSECPAKNPPTVGYCQRCWKMRKGWIKQNERDLRRSFTDPCSSTVGDDARTSKGFDVPDGRKPLLPSLSDCSTQSTITPILPSFSSPLKHKLDGTSSDSFMETEPKRMHLDTPETSVDSQMSGTFSFTSSSNESASGPGLCNICRNNPNDAAIIHGNTSHQFCCFKCAKRLKKRGKRCPVCRQQIIMIVRNFIVN